MAPPAGVGPRMGGGPMMRQSGQAQGETEGRGKGGKPDFAGGPFKGKGLPPGLQKKLDRGEDLPPPFRKYQEEAEKEAQQGQQGQQPMGGLEAMALMNQQQGNIQRVGQQQPAVPGAPQPNPQPAPQQQPGVLVPVQDPLFAAIDNRINGGLMNINGLLTVSGIQDTTRLRILNPNLII